jgi:hypothetical protein
MLYSIYLKALQNTEMVQMYAAMDQRVRILGYGLKVFVKVSIPFP